MVAPPEIPTPMGSSTPVEFLRLWRLFKAQTVEGFLAQGITGGSTPGWGLRPRRGQKNLPAPSEKPLVPRHSPGTEQGIGPFSPASCRHRLACDLGEDFAPAGPQLDGRRRPSYIFFHEFLQASGG